MERRSERRADKISWPIDKPDLLREILESKKQDELTPRALQMLVLIAYNANKKLRYKDHMDKEDCIAGGIEDILKYWRGFDPNVSTNAFAFYTQMAKNGYAKTWKRLHPNSDTISLSANDYNI